MSIGKELGYKRYFNVQELLFNIMGVDLEKKTVKHPALLVVPSIAFAVMMFFASWKNRHQTDVATASLAIAIDTVITIFKTFNVVRNHKKIVELIQSVCIMSKTDDVEEHAIIRDLNTQAYYFSNSIVIFGYGAFFSGCLAPFITTAVIYFKTGILMFSMANSNFSYFSFIDSSEEWKFALLQISIATFVFIGATCSLAIDTLYIWLVLNLMAQFRILSMRVKRAAALENLAILNRAAIECIRFHQQIIEFADNFDRSYRFINFVQFGVGCLPLGFVGFQISMGTGHKSLFVVYLLSKAFSTGMYCVLGQKIQDESYNVAENIYKTFSWHKLSKKSSQLLLIVMTRAQKCCNLTGIFFVIDISLFVWVYRTTTSYITILWTLAANMRE